MHLLQNQVVLAGCTGGGKILAARQTGETGMPFVCRH